MPRPSSATVEIEFTAGVWTAVSADVDWAAGWSYQVGRTTPQGSAQTSALSVTLYNTTGKYTPGVQILSDGTVNALYPNVVTRKRLRTSINGTVRWLGFVKGWYPQAENGVLGKVVVQAADRLDALARVGLRRAYVQEHFNQAAAAGGSALLWLMNEPPAPVAANTTFLEYSRAASPYIVTSSWSSDQVGQTFIPMPAADGLSGLSLKNGGVNMGCNLRPGIVGDFVISTWITLPIMNVGSGLSGNTAVNLPSYSASGFNTDPNLSLTIKYAPTPGTSNIAVAANFGVSTFASISGNGSVDDGNPHHYALLATTSAGTQTIALYVDGVQVGSSVTGASGQLNGVGALSLPFISAQSTSGFNDLPICLGPISQYSGGTYSAATVQALYGAGTGFAGDTTDQRVARILIYAGLTGADYSLDTGSGVMSSQPITGIDVVTAGQAAAMTEGGGSVMYVKAGSVAFKSRGARIPGVPALTLDAIRDLSRDVWQPSQDDSTQLNQITVERANDSGTVSTQTIDKSAGGQVLSESLTIYASTDADALGNAQDILARNATPGFRLPQVSVDLVTAENNLYAAAFTVGIGSRLRVTSIPAGMAPATQVDGIVEGWSEAYSKSNGVESYRFTFDTSAADSPAWFVWDDASYGRWQASGCTLNAGITAVATTLAIATTASNPTFTTDPTMYPLKIAVGAEHIQLNSAPGGSSSPQTFTGVTRGVDGTTAGVQAGAAAVDLAPASTWTL